MSAYVVWKPFYSVNDPSLDAEHRQILELIDSLHAAINAGREDVAIQNILDRLLQYTIDHFAHEEQVMQDSRYPGLDSHKVLHERMRQRTRMIHDHMDRVTGHYMLRFLNEWWIDHIQSVDKQYAPYLVAEVS
jgi:hemerythrin-like metal-binding protein